MRFVGRFEGRLPPSEVLARAARPTRDWIEAEVREAPNGAWLDFGSPIPLSLRVEIAPVEGGLRLDLVEGDLPGLSGQIRVAEAGSGSVAEVEVEVKFPSQVPGTLLRELHQRVLPGWFQALVDGQAADSE